MSGSDKPDLYVVPHNYDIEEKSNNKAPKFNGDSSMFSW
jgi:hypothetical protein